MKETAQKESTACVLRMLRTRILQFSYCNVVSSTSLLCSSSSMSCVILLIDVVGFHRGRRGSESTLSNMAHVLLRIAVLSCIVGIAQCISVHEGVRTPVTCNKGSCCVFSGEMSTWSTNRASAIRCAHHDPQISTSLCNT